MCRSSGKRRKSFLKALLTREASDARIWKSVRRLVSLRLLMSEYAAGRDAVITTIENYDKTNPDCPREF